MIDLYKEKREREEKSLHVGVQERVTAITRKKLLLDKRTVRRERQWMNSKRENEKFLFLILPFMT